MDDLPWQSLWYEHDFGKEFAKATLKIFPTLINDATGLDAIIETNSDDCNRISLFETS